jgi:hypothetical protein
MRWTVANDVPVFMPFILLIISFTLNQYSSKDALPVKSIVSIDTLGDQRSLNEFAKSPNELIAAGGMH